MDESFDYSDMSWLTQMSVNNVPTFKIMDSSYSEDEELFVSNSILNKNVVEGSCIDLENGKEVKGH